MLNRTFSEEWAVIGTVDPDAYASSPSNNQLTDAIDMSKYDEVVFIVAVGNLASAGNTINFKVTQATTSGGTYKDVTGAAITQLTGSPTDDDKQVIVTVDPNTLDVDNLYRWIKGSITSVGGTGTVDHTVIALGRAKILPASDDDLASVDQIVNV